LKAKARVFTSWLGCEKRIGTNLVVANPDLNAMPRLLVAAATVGWKPSLSIVFLRLVAA
jgi:hypothetical protein